MHPKLAALGAIAGPAVLITALALPGSDAWAFTYTVKELKPLPGGGFSTARAVNASGQMVGGATDKIPSPWATRWDAPGTTPSVWWGFGNENYFFSLNTASDMVGQDLMYTSGFPASYPLLATGSNLFTLATPPYAYGVANCINDRFSDKKTINNNSIAGAVSDKLGAEPDQRAVAWTGNGAMMVLDTLPGGDDLAMWNVAYSINAFGQVGGTSSMKGSPNEQAVIWGMDDKSIVTWLNDPNRDNPGEGGGVRDVRDAYYFAGYYYPTGEPSLVKHACYWDGTKTTHDIGTLYGGSSVAQAARNHDFTPGKRPELVGWSDRDTGSYGHITEAFAWDDVHGMRDLNALIPGGTGWDLQIAYDVGDDGRIVGTGTLSGERRGFVLMPYKIIKLPIDPGALTGGQSGQASIVMSDDAPDEVTVELRLSSPLVSVPEAVTIPRGRGSVDFTVATRPVRAPLDVVITATVDGQATAATLQVVP